MQILIHSAWRNCRSSCATSLPAWCRWGSCSKGPDYWSGRSGEFFNVVEQWEEKAFPPPRCRRSGVDPDSAAIPYLTAAGDLLGGAFLAAVFTITKS